MGALSIHVDPYGVRTKFTAHGTLAFLLFHLLSGFSLPTLGCRNTSQDLLDGLVLLFLPLLVTQQLPTLGRFGTAKLLLFRRQSRTLCRHGRQAEQVIRSFARSVQLGALPCRQTTVRSSTRTESIFHVYLVLVCFVHVQIFQVHGLFFAHRVVVTSVFIVDFLTFFDGGNRVLRICSNGFELVAGNVLGLVGNRPVVVLRLGRGLALARWISSTCHVQSQRCGSKARRTTDVTMRLDASMASDACSIQGCDGFTWPWRCTRRCSRG
mmetsp:Transcript_8203/g.50990  ORF Transcript_8203/g.50990 Transcript_8203/m.50990 type:complete len:267 (-) Transcript_8203:296-1096(-)